MFSNPESRPGGNALKFYATLIVRVTKDPKSVIRDKKGKIKSHDVQVKFEKSKTGELIEKPVQFTLKYDGTGVDNDKELFDFALNNGMIEGSGWYYFIDKKGIKIEKYGQFRRTDNGNDISFMDVLNENPEKKEELLKLIQVGDIFDEELSEEDYKEAYKEVKNIIKNETEVKRILNKKKDSKKVVEQEEVEETDEQSDEELSDIDSIGALLSHDDNDFDDEVENPQIEKQKIKRGRKTKGEQ